MNTENDSPNPGMTPPTEVTNIDGLGEQKQSSWPTVIGTIGIVLASLGLICGCSGYFSVPIQRWAVDMQSQGGQSNAYAEAQLAANLQFQMFTFGLVTIGLIVSVWFLVGSILLTMRRRSARKCLISWAIASMLVLGLNVCLQILIYQAVIDELNQMGEGQPGAQLWLGAILGGCFAIIFGLAFQVFILIWFSRAKIRNEVATWI